METTLYFGGPIVTLEEPQYAQALVERKALAVEGGHYRLCDGGECRRRGHGCPKKQKL